MMGGRIEVKEEEMGRRNRRNLGGDNPLNGLSRWWTVILVIAWWEQHPTPCQAQSPVVAPSSTACPLNFTALNPDVAKSINGGESTEYKCTAVDSGFEIILALYLRQSGFFLVPQGSLESCKSAYKAQLTSLGLTYFNFSACALKNLSAERGADLCNNIQTVEDVRARLPPSKLEAVNSSCSSSLQKATACSTCNLALANLANAFEQAGNGNKTSCNDFATLYTIGVVNQPGPLDQYTDLCILLVGGKSGNGSPKYVKFIAVGVGAMLLISLVGALIVYWRYRHVIAAKREARRQRTRAMLSATSVPTSSINWFTMEELKRATGHFTRDNILGTGGFGNVYKGTLPDGSLVAVKRFKNCAPAGDKDFVHEVEMISSVRHRHLVAIRGCCVDSSELLGGHQRIIVYDYMPNGSLADHLFAENVDSSHGSFLDWPTRSKIAVGMARGLAYLHHDARPTIIHRDIKPSNILLDTDFSARLADFGLAKFTPEGVSHLTTRVAGTYGYVSPEYALYGQLTEKSDVYSFGIVVLELISGRKALTQEDDEYVLVSDWAWPQVKEGKWRSVLDPKLVDDVESDDVMERFILVALLCAHPQVFYRPSIDQALRMLETSTMAVPPVPDRPLALTASQADVQESFSRSRSMNRFMERSMDLSMDGSMEGGISSNRTGFSSYYSLTSIKSTESS